jgi:hypothetical protein
MRRTISRLDLSVCDRLHVKEALTAAFDHAVIENLLRLLAAGSGPTETSVRARTESGYWGTAVTICSL